jgi:hypothetical protein
MNSLSCASTQAAGNSSGSPQAEQPWPGQENVDVRPAAQRPQHRLTLLSPTVPAPAHHQALAPTGRMPGAWPAPRQTVQPALQQRPGGLQHPGQPAVLLLPWCWQGLGSVTVSPPSCQCVARLTGCSWYRRLAAPSSCAAAQPTTECQPGKAWGLDSGRNQALGCW